MKNILLIVFLVIVLIQGLIISYLFYENRKIDKDITKLFLSQKIIAISEEPQIYICSKENAVDDFKWFMKQNGWESREEEQVGSGYFFEKGSDVQMYILNYEKSYACWIFER